MTGPVAFLFLGETLLIPHLFPIAEALARSSRVQVDLWVSTSVHEALLRSWTASDRIRIRRAPGFRVIDDAQAGRNPPLPFKPMMLARLLPHLLRAPVAVCAEQTSLWLPTLLPLPTRFVKTAHGAGSMIARADRRRRSPALTLVPAEAERQAMIACGVDASAIRVTGYVKAGFQHRTAARHLFAEDRPIILYTPHWQLHRSSWPKWGAEIVARLAAQDRYNAIIAPHQRLVETAPEVRGILAAVAGLAHMHCDLDSFAMVDGSYTSMADIYLGDTSSQVVEYIATPRPAIFLNAGQHNWADDAAYAQWRCGQVVDKVDELFPSLSRAPAVQPDFAVRQADFAASALGNVDGHAGERAANLILELLGNR